MAASCARTIPASVLRSQIANASMLDEAPEPGLGDGRQRSDLVPLEPCFLPVRFHLLPALGKVLQP